MKGEPTPKVINGQSPRIQIIRGLPGCGYETVARKYPCFHVAEDFAGYLAGRYDSNAAMGDASRSRFLSFVKDMMKKGIDLVVSGIFSRPTSALGWIVYFAMKYGYEVWIRDYLNEASDETPVRCTWQELERARQEFVPYHDEMFASSFNRFSSVKGDIRPSIDNCVDLAEFAHNHIHAGLMPLEYTCL